MDFSSSRLAENYFFSACILETFVRPLIKTWAITTINITYGSCTQLWRRVLFSNLNSFQIHTRHLSSTTKGGFPYRVILLFTRACVILNLSFCHTFLENFNPTKYISFQVIAQKFYFTLLFIKWHITSSYRKILFHPLFIKIIGRFSFLFFISHLIFAKVDKFTSRTCFIHLLHSLKIK